MKKYRRLFKKHQFYILTVVVFLVIALITAYVIVPNLEQINQHLTLLKSEKQRLEKLIKKRMLLASISQQDTLKLLAEAQQALPVEKDAASILISMNNLTSKTAFTLENINLNPGLISTDSAQIDSVTPAASVNRYGAYSMPIALKGRGTSDQLTNFINLMQNCRRVFSISKVNINFLEKDLNYLNATLDVLVYYLPPITEISQIEAELPIITQAEQASLAKLTQMENISLGLPEEMMVVATQVGKTNLFAP